MNCVDYLSYSVNIKDFLRISHLILFLEIN
jgi:hypothetical protein